jgi:hypothetical protein
VAASTPHPVALTGPFVTTETQSQRRTILFLRSPEVRRRFEATGKIAYVFRHFPLASIHPSEWMASKAAVCAAAQGRFWEMHDFLFLRQAARDQVHLVEATRSLGLEEPAFGACLRTETDIHIEDDLLQGRALGVSETPTFVVVSRRSGGPATAVARCPDARACPRSSRGRRRSHATNGPAQLAEQHRDELAPTGEPARVALRVRAVAGLLKFGARKELE